MAYPQNCSNIQIWWQILCQNYQPISLLCCISKVLEHIVFNKIYDYVSPHLYTSIRLYGVQIYRPTIIFSNSICDAFNRKNHVDVTYIDIKKGLWFSSSQNFWKNSTWSSKYLAVPGNSSVSTKPGDSNTSQYTTLYQILSLLPLGFLRGASLVLYYS